MSVFVDQFTGTAYQTSPEWLETVQARLAAELQAQLAPEQSALAAANKVATFWSDTYYQRLFPLRFGLKLQDGHYTAGSIFPEPDGEMIRLPAEAGKAGSGPSLREKFMDGLALPPLLPAFDPTTDPDSTSTLLADQLLSQAALTNLLLRRQETAPENLHQLRLACLIYPFFTRLNQDLIIQRWPITTAAIRFWVGGALTAGLEPYQALLTAVQNLSGFPPQTVGLGSVAVQRIKQYVFETPGLNEIRGASTLLDQVTEQAKLWLGRELGPEVILRSAGATLIFLAPTLQAAQERVSRIKQAFYRATGTAMVTGAATAVEVESLLRAYDLALAENHQAQEQERSRNPQPTHPVLPFESRCWLCKVRPAVGWSRFPGQVEAKPVCRVCQTKRKVGRDQADKKIKEMINWLPHSAPADLGLSLAQPADDYIARSLGPDGEEDGLVPARVRRSLLATIYGDGNNFGAVVKAIKSLAQARQWTQRVEKSTRAAAALALVQATQEAARDRGWQPPAAGGGSSGPPSAQTGRLTKIPFQILALGGDDLSLFAWAPVGIRFAAYYPEILDREFAGGSYPKLTDQPIAFSLGAILTDHKAAVRRTVQFAEDELLTWAKQAFRDSSLGHGTIATLLADKLEQIPDDLKIYRQKMYVRQGAISLHLTLRPYTAAELTWLLAEAQTLRQSAGGAFHRLVAAVVQASPMQGLLHYIYQSARLTQNNSSHWLKRLDGELSGLPASLQGLRLPATPEAGLGRRKPFGLRATAPAEPVWFTPLWDLLELIKILD